MRYFYLFFFILISSTLFSEGIEIKHFKLKNGLKVYMSKNSSAPTVAVALYYDVGSRDEAKNRTGFAHLFEHMMFQGSKNVGKAEHFKYIENSGGQMNGTTSRERTNFYEVLPSNKLELALWLEADRMESLMVNNLNFLNQREVVIEEKKQVEDNRAYGKVYPQLQQLAYSNFNYSHSVIGSVKHLEESTVIDAKNFYKKFYNPNNATLTIVGDIDYEKTEKLVKKHFGDIENSGVKIKRNDFTEKEQKKIRKKTIKDKHAKVPAIAIAYQAPSPLDPDFYALSMLESILLNDNSSRLYQKLVKEKEYCLNIGGGVDYHRGPNLFFIFSIFKPGKLNKVKTIIFKEIENIKKFGVKKEELEKAKLKKRTEHYFQLQSNLNRALLIGKYALYFDKPELINSEIDMYQKVTVDDIKKVVKKYLSKKRLNELVVEVK